MYKAILKFYQREVTQKLRKEEQSFLYVTHHLNLIHIAIKFNQDIPYGYLGMPCTRIVWELQMCQYDTDAPTQWPSSPTSRHFAKNEVEKMAITLIIIGRFYSKFNMTYMIINLCINMNPIHRSF